MKMRVSQRARAAVLWLAIGAVAGHVLVAQVRMRRAARSQAAALVAAVVPVAPPPAATLPTQPATRLAEAATLPAVAPLPKFEYPTLPEQMRQGEEVTLALKPPLPDGYEIRWMTKYQGEDWDWNTPWSTRSEFTFRATRPGVHSLNLAIRRKGEIEDLVRADLKQVLVQARLVDMLDYTPGVTTARCGTVIEFVMAEKPNVSFKDLEFRLWNTAGATRVLQDWRPWPLDPYVAASPGTVALQVDVRLRDTPTVIDKHWLGQIFISDKQEQYGKNNLLRDLIADDFGELSDTLARTALTQELWVTSHLLIWEQQGIAPAELPQRLKQLRGVSDAQWQDQHVEIVLGSGHRYTFDPASGLYQQSGSALQMELSVETYPQYGRIFRQMKGLGDTEKALAALNHAITEGYCYGRASMSQYSPLFKQSLDCGSRAALLMQCLQISGLPAEMVTVSNAASRAVHALVSCRLGDGVSLVLDPTLGCVYKMDIRKVREQGVPAPLFPPTVRFLPELELPAFFSRPATLFIFNRLKAGIVPPGSDQAPECIEWPGPSKAKEQ